jgi:hypothetical protein
MAHDQGIILDCEMVITGSVHFPKLGCPSAASPAIRRQGDTSVIGHKQLGATTHARHRTEGIL